MKRIVFASSLVLAAVSALVACIKGGVDPSSGDPSVADAGADAGADACGDAGCSPGSVCVTVAGVASCRTPCTSNSDPAGRCAYGYLCTDPGTGEAPYCVESQARRKDGTPLVERPGQWGRSCSPADGLVNTACDGEQGFLCHAESPTDSSAYCTRYDCTTDQECGPGFGCATINRAPNAVTADRGAVGDVQRVCLLRTYCAPCTGDVDCGLTAGGAMHCIPDGTGSAVCLPECSASTQCPNEAFCASGLVADAKVCYPRAHACRGDGSICAPCRADSDCGVDGACVKGTYTTERSCAKKSASLCASKDCPPAPTNLPSASTGIGCEKVANAEVPQGYCVGVYQIGGQSADVGCYTPAR
jgi:hypothetical protein